MHGGASRRLCLRYGEQARARPLHEHAHADDGGDNGAEYDGEYNRADDDHDRIPDGLFRRRLHHWRQPEPEQIKTVEAENRKESQPGNEQEHAGEPRRRVGIDRDLEGAREALLAVEGGRQQVDDQRHDVDVHERKDVVDHRYEQRPYDGRADDDAPDEAAHRRDRSEDRDVIAEQVTRIARLAGDHRPFRLRRKNDSLHPLDQVHRSPPLVAVDYASSAANPKFAQP